MALPNQIDPATPGATDVVSSGDDQIRALKQFLIDVFGLPNATNLTAAITAINTVGALTVGLMFDLAADGNVLVAKRAGTIVWSLYADDAESKLTIRDSAGVVRFSLNLATGAIGTATLAATLLTAGAGDTILKTKVIDIGDWDMDVTATVNVAHGLTLANIRRLSVVVRDDLSTSTTPLNYSSSTGVVQGTYLSDGSIVALDRLTGGVFDNTTYNATSFNRGWIVIDYV